jgi:hypothetical protein
MGRGRLSALVAYGRGVYDLRERLDGVRDGRQEPVTSAPLVAASIFFCGLLRIRSLNALEPRLGEKPFMRVVGAPPEVDVLCSADTLSRSLRSMALERARAISIGIVAQAERNKVFREGWVGAQRYVALDGWEPFQSFGRHCDRCLVRVLKVKQRDGTWREVEQYFHRFAVAMLIDERFDLLLDYEPLLPADLRPRGASKNDEDEGELTTARRLLRHRRRRSSRPRDRAAASASNCGTARGSRRWKPTTVRFGSCVGA